MNTEKKTTEEKQTVQHGTEQTPATDPQENMEGPLSSLMHSTGDAFDTGESKEEADRQKEEKM